MNKYGNLIKSNVISLEDTLIQNFKKLEIDEVDVIILIFLNRKLKNNDPLLDVKELNSHLTIKSKELSDRIMKLLRLELVELEQNDNGQVFNLNGLMNELGKTLEEGEKPQISDTELIKKIINYVEVTYQKELKPVDLEYVNTWVLEKKSFEDIREAILVSVRMNKMNLSYVDRILSNNRRDEPQVNVDPRTKELLKSIHVRKH